MLRYTHQRLLVADYRAMFGFYRDVLGFTPTFMDENDLYADFDTGAVSIAIFPRSLMAETIETSDKPAEAHCQDRTALIFSVENVDSACAELRNKGVTLLTEPQDRAEWGIRTAHFRDPDGNLLEIYSPLAA